MRHITKCSEIDKQLNITIYKKDPLGTYTKHQDVAHLEFYQEFIIIQYWDGSTETVDADQIDMIMVVPEESNED